MSFYQGREQESAVGRHFSPSHGAGATETPHLGRSAAPGHVMDPHPAATGMKPKEPGHDAHHDEQHAPHVPKDPAGKYSYYKNAIEKSGGKFDARPGQRNIIGIRGFQNGKLNDNERDKYNDTLAVMWVDEKGKPHVEEYNGSVDPGKTTPGSDKGMAHLIDGQYDYSLGIHHGKSSGAHEALVDHKSHVWRDKNNNGVRDPGDNEDTGQLGINIHAGGRGQNVGPNSVGCQVIQGGYQGKQWKSFMQSMKDDPDGKFKYTLMDGSRLAGFEQNRLGEEVKAPDGPSKGIDPGAFGKQLRDASLSTISNLWDSVKHGWEGVKKSSSHLLHSLLGPQEASRQGAKVGEHGGGVPAEESSHHESSEGGADSVDHKAQHLTDAELRRIVPGMTDKRAAKLLGPLNHAIELAGCTTDERKAMFLAQLAHESGGFKFMHELGGASYFNKYEPGTKIGARLGNKEAGDGARFKGRGFIQITGRDNYEKAGKAIGVDLVNHPEKAEEPETAAKVAAWYWRTHTVSKGKGAHRHTYHLNDLADQGDFVGVTRGVNGGTNGLRDREAYYARAKAEFRKHPEGEEDSLRSPSAHGEAEPGVIAMLEGGWAGLKGLAGSVLDAIQHWAD